MGHHAQQEPDAGSTAQSKQRALSWQVAYCNTCIANACHRCTHTPGSIAAYAQCANHATQVSFGRCVPTTRHVPGRARGAASPSGPVSVRQPRLDLSPVPDWQAMAPPKEEVPAPPETPSNPAAAAAAAQLARAKARARAQLGAEAAATAGAQPNIEVRFPSSLILHLKSEQDGGAGRAVAVAGGTVQVEADGGEPSPLSPGKAAAEAWRKEMRSAAMTRLVDAELDLLDAEAEVEAAEAEHAARASGSRRRRTQGVLFELESHRVCWGRICSVPAMLSCLVPRARTPARSHGDMSDQRADARSHWPRTSSTTSSTMRGRGRF